MKKTAVRALCRTLQEVLRTLRQLYALPAGAGDGRQDALLPFLPLLLQEGESALHGLRHAPGLPAGENGLPRAYVRLQDLLSKGAELTQDTLIAGIADAGFSFTELTLTALLLRAACVVRAAKAQEKETAVQAAKTLETLSRLDFSRLFARASEAERLCLADAGFCVSDDATKGAYRAALSRYAKKRKQSEEAAARGLLQRAKAEHTTLWRLLTEKKTPVRGWVLLTLEWGLPLFSAAALSVWLRAWWLLPLLFFPLYAGLSPFLEAVALRGAKPVPLPVCRVRSRVQKSQRTLVTVSALLPESGAWESLRDHLEEVCLSAGRGAVGVCLLADLKASPSAENETDRADIDEAKRMIDALNAKFPGRFVLLVRARTFSETQRVYTGFERKRGALCALFSLLQTGDRAAFSVCHGAEKLLCGVKYVLALDGDTTLAPDCLVRLLAAARHPENTAHIDQIAHRVTRGYAVFVPQTELSPEAAFRTRFSRLMTGAGGISGYARTLCERWQAHFHAGLFTGKGLMEVSVCASLLPGLFRKETVLSHDIPEGEALRTAFVGAAQAAEGFPTAFSAYLARLGRWVRGDAQNVVLLSGKLRGEAAITRLAAVSRIKLLDCLRRDVTPAVSFLLCLLAPLMPGYAETAALLCVLFSVAAPAALSFFGALRRGGFSALSARYFGGTLPEAAKAVSEFLLSLVLLPATGWVCLCAFFKGLYRRLCSHRRMLDWVTAADSEGQGNAALLRRSLPAVLGAAWLLLFGGALARGFALFFLAAPAFAVWSAKPYKAGIARALSPAARETLREDAAAMWKFYRDLCTEKDHFLPPDNVQFTPVRRTAHRTSPTNIGLMLCAALAACDLGFISEKELGAHVCRTLATVQKLETWHGNLYNWYDTETLEPLPPRFVSAVDSGNFLCCLAALSAGLSEYEAKSDVCRRARETAEEILQNTHLSKLFDRKSGLFYIGYDAERGAFSPSHYDLLMSESRMMSYYAVASHEVPVSHWGALSRVLSKSGGLAGALAWSGTMFEFFMPYLFLESPAGTLAHESLCFCVREQARFAAHSRIPFGVSESGYYAFDGAGNYQYRAHGVPALALRRTKPAENRVTSPYSAFLCLPFAPAPAQKSLQRLRALGAFGEYGFYEAVDFSVAPEGKIVRSFMAHHVGMSLIATANCLFSNVFQKRFLAYGTLRSARALLSERAPEHTPLPRRRAPRFLPERELRRTPQPAKTVESPLPACAQVYSNGAWTAVLTDCGTGFSLCGGVRVIRGAEADFEDIQGVFAVLQTESGALPLCRAAAKTPRAQYTCAFLPDGAVYTARSETVYAETKVFVHAAFPAEQRTFQLCNRTGTPISGRLLVYLEPSLTTEKAETAHKAFQKLFVTARYAEAQNAVVFHRRAGRGQEPQFLGCAFFENEPFDCALQREEVLRRGAGVFSLETAKIAGKQASGAADVCFAAAKPVYLPAHGEQTVTLCLCAAGTSEETLRRLDVLRRTKVGAAGVAQAIFPARLWQETVLPALFCGGRLQKERETALSENQNDVRALWAMGVSGDFPILLLENADTAGEEKLLPFANGALALQTAGMPCDLVLCAAGEAGLQTLRALAASKPTLLRLQAARRLFLVDTAAQPEEARTALRAFSACGFDLSCPLAGQALPAAPAFAFAKVCAPVPEARANGVEGAGYLVAQKPVLPWCWVLSNPTFGTLVGDSSLGTSFAGNARLNKLTRFTNDTMLDCGERLYLRTAAGRIFDVLRTASAHFDGSRAVFEADVQALHIRVTVRVPARGMCKEVSVALENRGKAEARLGVCCYIRPALCEAGSPSPFLQSAYRDGALFVRNPANTAVKGTMCLYAQTSGEPEKYFRSQAENRQESEKYCRLRGKESEKYFRSDAENTFYTVSDTDFQSGVWDSGGALPGALPCAALGKEIVLPAEGAACVRFRLSFARSAAAAKRLAEMDLPFAEAENRVQLSSSDQTLNELYNLFLVRQVKNGRLFARTGLYQSGGAWGFRDQLQDAASLLLVQPELLRRQLLRCSAAQFLEGDVLHWWHALPDGRVCGVRTRCSDDLLWLPLFLAQYVRATGDRSILRIEVPYRAAPELGKDEDERYFEVPRADVRGSVLDHAVRAIRRALKKGGHGLLLMGTGDWNDSFNRVGRKGKGESVWLTQFAVIVLENFAALLETEPAQTEFRSFCLSEAEALREAIETHAYEGDRYLRAFYDDGGKMGAAGCPSCAIDSLTQSFAVFARLDKARTKTALRTAFSELYDEAHGILRLFSPPFYEADNRAGYVSAYPPGIRENGGQYTHAAVWFCRALLEAGLYDEGMRALCALNPLEKYEDAETARRYKTEPYFLCGDVYAGTLAGRGGWSLYTGSAGQLFALVTEVILGVRLRGGRLYFEPAGIPQMGAFSYTLVYDGAEISVEVAAAPRAGEVLIDGSPATCLLPDGKNHCIKIR